jgi:hypothetical protein
VTGHPSDDLKNLGAADAGDATGGPQATVRVRATVHLPGGPLEPSLRPGDVVDVPLDNPYIQDCLRAQTLVPLPSHLQPDR